MDLKLYHSFGLNSDIVHNVTFYNENTLVFIAGKLSILLDLTTLQQKIIQIAEGHEMTVISRCADQLAMALKGRPPSVCLLNIASDNKRIYHSPVKMKSDKYLCISVSASLKFVAAQGSSPDWKLVIWLATTRDIVAVFNPTSKRPSTAIREISFHAGGREEVVVVGKNVFRLYEYQETQDANITFKEIIFDKYEAGEEYCAIAWPQKETLAVSTLKGKVLFFRGIEFVHEVAVSKDVTEALKDKFGSSGLDFTSVTCLACTAKEIFCTVGGNIVAAYKGEEVPQYTLNRLLMLPTQRHTRLLPGKLEVYDDIITLMDLSPSNELVVVSTTNGQLFYCSLDDEGKYRRYFQALFKKQHARPILAMDVARGRPLIVTASKRRAILWNYKTKEQELFLMFKDAISCVAIHPSGLYLALGFVLYTRMCTILYNGLKDRHILEPQNCARIRFSYGGHMLALASEAVIDVYDFMTSGKLARLEGHAGRVSFMAWKDDDTRLISCDLLGVICEWDVTTWTKMWENTDTVSYSYLVVTPSNNRIIVINSGKGLKCVADGFVDWELNCQDELMSIVACEDDEKFYAGRKDGSLALYKLPTIGLSSFIHAHNGEVTCIMFCHDYRMLFTISTGGLLFGWMHGKITEEAPESVLSNVVFVSTSDLQKQKDREELLRMTLKQCNVAFEYDLKLNKLNHEESKRKILVNHESAVRNLNIEIAVLKEKIQDLVFDSSPSNDLRNIEDIQRKRMFEQTEKLAETYKKTDNYVAETREMVQNYEDTLKSLEKEYAEVCADVKEREKEILAKIKDLESLIAKEKVVSEGQRNSFDDEKKRIQDEEAAQEKILMETERFKHESEKNKSKELEEELKRLQLLKVFVQKDNQRKQNNANGQIDLDISEKSHSIHVLEQKLRDLEYKLKANDKIAQKQDAKFFETKRLVGDLQRADSISKNETKLLKMAMKSTEKEIESCQAEIKEITLSLPSVEEQVRLVKDQCSTLGRKLRETINGFDDKRKLLRHNQSLMDKYKSLLYQSRTQTCDVGELRKKILQLFIQIKKGTDETLDPNLKHEFEHQIQTLQDIYKEIKGEPTQATKDLSLAEFKLSQENAKLLREVHEIQKEHDKLRDVVFEMEVAMGMPYTKQAKITKDVDETRDMIELVIRSSTRKDIASGRKKEIERLDKLIGEQQDEIQRLQAMISEKTEQK